MEVPGEPAGKRIARPCGILNVLQRICRGAEDRVVGKQQGTVLSFLDDESVGPHVSNQLCRPYQIGLVGQLAGLGVVDHKAVHPREGLSEAVRSAFDPVVHRVGHDELRIGHLVQHIPLNAGL